MTIRRNPFIALVAILMMVAAACSSASTGLQAADVPAAEPDTSDEEPVPEPERDADPSGGGSTEEPQPDAMSEGEADEAVSDEPAEQPRGENQLPAVDVVDLATGDTVSLASFAPTDRPIVLWFWAPH